MLNEFELEGLPIDKKQTLVSTFITLKRTQEYFSNTFEQPIKSSLSKSLKLIMDKCFDYNTMLQYIYMIKDDTLGLKVHLSELFTYTLILSEINKNPSILEDNLKLYKDTGKHNHRRMFFIAMNYLIDENLNKVVDNLSNIVYTMNLNPIFDNFIMSRLLVHVLHYGDNYSFSHDDNIRKGYIEYYKCKGIDCEDPVIVPYLIC